MDKYDHLFKIQAVLNSIYSEHPIIYKIYTDCNTSHYDWLIDLKQKY